MRCCCAVAAHQSDLGYTNALQHCVQAIGCWSSLNHCHAVSSTDQKLDMADMATDLTLHRVRGVTAGRHRKRGNLSRATRALPRSASAALGHPHAVRCTSGSLCEVACARYAAAHRKLFSSCLHGCGAAAQLVSFRQLQGSHSVAIGIAAGCDRRRGPLSGAPKPPARSASAALCGAMPAACSFSSSAVRRLCGLPFWCVCRALSLMKCLLQAMQ
jgi:hypothetical protein